MEAGNIPEKVDLEQEKKKEEKKKANVLEYSKKMKVLLDSSINAHVK